MESGSEYSKTRQCARCGCTWPVGRLKATHRKDEVLGIDETVLVCVDLPRCQHMKKERRALLVVEARAALARLGKRVRRKPKPELAVLEKLSKGPKQFYPLLREGRRLARKVTR